MRIQRFVAADTVKLCRKNFCIEARGENGRILIATACVALLLIALAALVNATK